MKENLVGVRPFAVRGVGHGTGAIGMEAGRTYCDFGGIKRAIEDRSKQRQEHDDDRDSHQQLDQRKRLGAAGAVRVHGASFASGTNEAGTPTSLTTARSEAIGIFANSFV